MARPLLREEGSLGDLSHIAQNPQPARQSALLFAEDSEPGDETAEGIWPCHCATGNFLRVTEVRCSDCPPILLFPDPHETAVTPPSKERLVPPMANPIPANDRAQIAKRRSSRIALHTQIGLSGEDIQKCHFTMLGKASNLNRYGAAIHVARQTVGWVHHQCSQRTVQAGLSASCRTTRNFSGNFRVRD